MTTSNIAIFCFLAFLCVFEYFIFKNASSLSGELKFWSRFRKWKRRQFTRTIMIRELVYRDDSSWVAHNIDADIIVKSEDRDVAVGKLKNEVQGFLFEVVNHDKWLERDEDTAQRLLSVHGNVLTSGAIPYKLPPAITDPYIFAITKVAVFKKKKGDTIVRMVRIDTHAHKMISGESARKLIDKLKRIK